MPAAKSGSNDSSSRISPRSFPYDVVFSETRITSRTPVATISPISETISDGVRDTKDPRKRGIAQKAHLRSQPLASLTEATGPVPKRMRGTGGL